MVKLTDPQAAPKTVDVKLFRSFHAGMGDAEDVHYNHRMEQYSSPVQVLMRYNRVHGSAIMRQPGEIRMGFQVKQYAATNHDLVPVFGIEWTDTNGVYPAIFYLVGKKIMKIAGLAGVAVVEVGSDALATNATGGAFHDDGSGIPYLYASFGGVAASSAKIRRMNLAQTVTTSADVTAALLLSNNGSMYRTTVAVGQTAACYVDRCPIGKDAFTLANYVGSQQVGFAGTSINVLTSVRQAPVAIKPEGIFVYNQGLDAWINITPSWRNFLHSKNGFGAFPLGDSLVIPMGDGGAVIFDGNNVKPFDPISLESTPNWHTPTSAISCMSAMRHYIAAATGPAGDGDGATKLESMGNSLYFYRTVDNVAFTDDSASVRDLNLNTSSVLPANAALKIYIGWKRPFTAVRFDTGAANIVARTLTVSVGTVAGSPGTYTSVAATDFTSLGGATLGQSGDIVLQVDPVDTTGWVQTTVNGQLAYWMLLSFSGALTASTNWLNCQIQPWYPSCDKTNFPLDGLDKSGCFPHILMGRGDSTTGGTWHDMASLSLPDHIGLILFSNIGGSSINRARNMIAIGRFSVWQILTAQDDMPAREAAPVLNGTGLVEGPAYVIEDGAIVRLKQLKIVGHGFDPAWKLFFYYTWDYGKKWSHASTEVNVPALQDFTDKENRGNKFRWAIGWKGTAGEALSQPVVTGIEATFEVLDVPFDSSQTRPVQNVPPRN